MTAEQAATLKRLAEAAYELEAFQPNLTRAPSSSAGPANAFTGNDGNRPGRKRNRRRSSPMSDECAFSQSIPSAGEGI